MQVKSIAECSKGHSAILLTCIKLPFIIKIFVLSIFYRPFYTGFTVHAIRQEFAPPSFPTVKEIYFQLFISPTFLQSMIKCLFFSAINIFLFAFVSSLFQLMLTLMKENVYMTI